MGTFFRVFVPILVVIILAFALNYYAVPSALMQEAEPAVTLNWLGIVVTVVSLCFGLFLALMAIDAFGRLKVLDEHSKRSGALLGHLEETDRTVTRHLHANVSFANDTLEQVVRVISSISTDNDNFEEFAIKCAVARSRLEISVLLPQSPEFLQKAGKHFLLLAEHGSRDDAEFCLKQLGKMKHRQEAYALEGIMLRRLGRAPQYVRAVSDIKGGQL